MESDSDSESDILCKRRRVDPNLPKYYEYNSIQNQEGYFGGLMDMNTLDNSIEER